MKKHFKVLMLPVILCVGAVAQADPAMIIKDGICRGFVPNGETESGFPALEFLVGTDSHSVKSGKGNQKITCHFDHSTDLDHATGGQGFLCGTNFGLTTDSKMLATPGGRATLTCMVKAND